MNERNKETNLIVKAWINTNDKINLKKILIKFQEFKIDWLK